MKNSLILLVITFMLFSINPVFGQDEAIENFDFSQDQISQPNHDYIVGVDDILDISVIKPEAISSRLTVSPDGTITFPYVGKVQAKGLTLPEIQDEIQSRLADGYMEYPVVSVSLQVTRSKKFAIYGQIQRPGFYPIEDDMRVLHSLTVAGGLSRPGAMAKIKLLRLEKNTQELKVVEADIKEILTGSDKNILIESGDLIIVSLDKVFISGQVVRPGAYPVEEDMTVSQAITLAGGFSQPHVKGKVKLFRPQDSGNLPEVMQWDIREILTSSDNNILVKAKDTIIVSLDKFFVSGQVVRPGAYQVEDNINLLRAITLAGGFARTDISGTVKVVKAKMQEGGLETVKAKIKDVLEGKYSDLIIDEKDTIVVTQDKFFTYGEINRPGVYPLEEGVTVLTAISMSGGFTKFGSASKVKVLRMNKETSLYDIHQVNINTVVDNGFAKEDILLEPGDIVVVSEGMF